MKGTQDLRVQVTVLAEGQITAIDTLTIELVEANDTPAVVIIRWPAKASVLHTRLLPAAADVAARIFATAVVRLAQIRRTRSCEEGFIVC
jgi:hypothetical protein